MVGLGFGEWRTVLLWRWPVVEVSAGAEGRAVMVRMLLAADNVDRVHAIICYFPVQTWHAKHCSFSYSDWASIEQMNQRKWRVTQAEHAEANGWVRHQKLCTPPPAAAAAATADDDGNDDDGAGASGADHSAKSMMLRVSGSNASFLVVQGRHVAPDGPLVVLQQRGLCTIHCIDCGPLLYFICSQTDVVLEEPLLVLQQRSESARDAEAAAGFITRARAWWADYVRLSMNEFKHRPVKVSVRVSTGLESDQLTEVLQFCWSSSAGRSGSV
eukprot:138804-Pelagomonas_calceolata.AAC.1